MSAVAYEHQARDAHAAPMPPTSAHSSPEFEAEDDPAGGWPAAETSPSASASSKVPLPAKAQIQKRRRVTRACDECRRKKIKCDGKQPCTHCTVYSYDCTYDQPSNRRRNPLPQYTEALENRCQRLEQILRTLLPNVDLHDPNLEAAILQRSQAPDTNVARIGPPQLSGEVMVATTTEQDAQLRSMIESTGQLDLDERGHWDFHGGSSGTVFVKRMREQFGNLLGGGENAPVLPRLPRTQMSPLMFDSPGGRSTTQSPIESGLPNTMDLPSREAALVLCAQCLHCGCSLLRFVHEPSFYEMFDRIYSTPPENFGDDENRFLPLLYTSLAVGCMFQKAQEGDLEQSAEATYKLAIDEGLKYFRAARLMMDVTDCRDISSLQSVLFMILFLQASANLSTCYSYIGIALRSSLRMGLHRNLAGNFNPIERETRKRVFWVIRKMDTYVSALLGFPQMLSSDDIDQELPIEVDDEYITRDTILPMPQGKISLYAASNAHTDLMRILAKVIKYIYPLKGLELSMTGTTKASYIISHAKIREVEKDLADWLDRLPMRLRPGGEGTAEVLRVQQLLRLAYAHVQMMLYRPFLHYVSEKSCAGKNIDDRSYACAAACVSVSRNIVHITSEMKRRGLLVGAYWFTMYTTFFAILSLVFFVLENPDKNGSQEILADADSGKEALKGLARKSMAADRCSMALSGLFEQLPDRMKKTRPTSLPPKKKRSAVASPEMAKAELAPPQLGIPRATTFPTHPTPIQTTNLPNSTIADRFHMNTSSNPNLRQSFHDLRSPVDAGTPDSGNSSLLQTPYGLPPTTQDHNQLAINTNGLPDLSAMMFPSADPFAYPNQPMMELENVKQESQARLDISQAPPIFLPDGTDGGIYDDLEGQLFGPLPPYLMQGVQNFDMSQDLGSGTMGGLQQQNFVGYGLATSNDLEAIFAGDGEDWDNYNSDGRFRQM